MAAFTLRGSDPSGTIAHDVRGNEKGYEWRNNARGKWGGAREI